MKSDHSAVSQKDFGQFLARGSGIKLSKTTPQQTGNGSLATINVMNKGVHVEITRCDRLHEWWFLLLTMTCRIALSLTVFADNFYRMPTSINFIACIIP
ncbi:MAG: hypothetical protein ABI760_12705 [Ferruginibacter sp.]